MHYRGSPDAIEKLDSQARLELTILDEELNVMRTQRLIRIANRLLLPIPSPDDPANWEEMESQLGRVLTRSAQRELIRAIRTERKERSDIGRLRLAAWTGLIGTLGGLLIGALSLLLRK